MHFQHAPAIWQEFPELAAVALRIDGVRADADVSALCRRFEDRARERLAGASESDLPEIQAWRRTFQRMGLKPTQYRCASESLLRRLRKEGDLPRIHPMVDLCNAVSVAFAIPVAALDLANVAGWLEVRHADGSERYEAFSGEIEHPEPREVTFVDAEGRSHARRWTHRQSGLSAMRASTRSVLVVSEAVHAGAREDIARLGDELGAALQEGLGQPVTVKRLRADDPRFSFG
jgi:DNA/RNA-binding domain of Phe-tRNA-synthetase-like protein